MEFDTEKKSLQYDSENYLQSLTRLSLSIPESDILLLSGDTINLKNLDTTCLIFYFPPNECTSCVDGHIFDLEALSEKLESQNIFITTDRNRINFLKQVSRTQRDGSISFGFFLNSTTLSKICYFLVSKNGRISNIYYPEKANSESTQRYLKYVIDLIK